MKYYVYKITNKINGKIYIGVHGSNDIVHDDYMGPGTLIKRALKKYGKMNFERELLFEYEDYLKAYEKENEIVNEEFCEDSNNYNIKIGGVVCFLHTPEAKKTMSQSLERFWSSEEGEIHREQKSKEKKELWNTKEYREKMEEIFASDERNNKLSTNLKKWINEHPEEHAIRMNKINKNPVKIEKTAQKHRGTKRTKETCENISKSLIGKNKGKDNKEFIGYYITPFGTFESLESASIACGCCKIAIRDRCRIKNENKVVLNSILTDKSGKLTRNMVGKTWKELGWGFVYA